MEAADWASLSDQELLERRISKLGLRLDGTTLEPLIRQLYDELSAHGLVFHPPCHIGDEWFVPIGIPAIFVPFFLVHDRLRALERAMMLEVEGETAEWFMKLMRHEAAHAYTYAYQLTRKKKWQQTFGRTSREETPDSYRPRPFSRSYVVHLDDWYAQSHPDEDFAETFAVWLTPGLDWRKRYAGWKALHPTAKPLVAFSVDDDGMLLWLSNTGKPADNKSVIDYLFGNSNVQALPIIELDFSNFPAGLPKIASWSAKWGEDGDGKGAEFAGTESVFPTDLPEELATRIKQVAVDAFQALRLRDYARVDLRVTDSGRIYVIEVNPNCYLEAKSEFATAAAKEGIEYPALINRIVELASARYSR